MPRTGLRPCIARVNDKEISGYFHQFFVFPPRGGYSEAYLGAIIELESGHLAEVWDVTQIQFTDIEEAI